MKITHEMRLKTLDLFDKAIPTICEILEPLADSPKDMSSNVETLYEDIANLRDKAADHVVFTCLILTVLSIELEHMRNLLLTRQLDNKEMVN